LVNPVCDAHEAVVSSIIEAGYPGLKRPQWITPWGLVHYISSLGVSIGRSLVTP
jgi:hypothetical protein